LIHLQLIFGTLQFDEQRVEKRIAFCSSFGREHHVRNRFGVVRK